MDHTTLKRPQPGDNEEELLKMQEEFLSSKQEPSAKVINLRKTSSTNSPLPCKEIRISEFKKQKLEKNKLTQSRVCGETIHPTIRKKIEEKQNEELEDPIQNIPSLAPNVILGNIVEKHHNLKTFKFQQNNNSLDLGFPKVFTLNEKICKSDANHSLFWQKIKDHKKENPEVMNSCSNHMELETNIRVDEIHRENLVKLNQMSEAEILREKSILESTLKPDLIKFLKNRKKNFQQSETNVIESTAMECQDIPDLPEPSKDILETGKSKGWIHMDSLEPEKLKWMKDLPIEEKPESSPSEPYTARFDFNGTLLPFQDESIPINQGLHHHGEEPERPGYSLQELLQLSRSSTQQQRCTALTTLANIIEKCRQGLYDKVLEPSPLVALCQKNILLLLRFSLDDTSVAVITATLQALRALLYNEADEVCLDRLFGWNDYVEPDLTVPPSDVDNADLKDHELAQLDVVAAALRSDIILRIRYVLNEIKPPPIAVTCAMDILIRLARHSHITALNIANTPYFLESIVENFMPLSTDKIASQKTLNNVYGVPLINAIRLCRVLVCYGKKPVADRLNRLKIIQPILTYISIDEGKEGINLIIESLRLWKLLLNYEVATDSLGGASLTLVSQLKTILTNLDLGNFSELSYEHAGALIAVATSDDSLRPHVLVLLKKWSEQLSSISSPTWCMTKMFSQALLAVNDISELQTKWISNSKIFSTLRSTSNLLSGITLPTEREPPSLPSLGVMTERETLQPIVSHDSCIPFLTVVMNVFHKYHLVSEIKEIFNQPEFYKYIQELENHHWYLQNSWYTRKELSLLTAIVRAISELEEELNPTLRQTAWKMTIKLVSALPADNVSDVNDILSIALSNKKLKLERLINQLANLQLNLNEEKININLQSDIAHLYAKYISKNGYWNQSAMPQDWLYLPIVHIYTNMKNLIDEKSLDQEKNSILAVIGLEMVLPELVERLSPSLRFSRLTLVYLCDTIYLDKDVSPLLYKAMSSLIKKYYTQLDFTSEVPGLNSFTDLFTSMCEHFSSTSYGDYNFSMVLLILISQRHDVHYRKLLWSEHAGVLRYLRLPINQLIVPVKEYLYPIEKDESLIEYYLTALVRQTIRQEWCPIPYMIALHHSALYLKGPSKLAVRMKTQLQKIPNKILFNALLQYKAPNE